MQNRFLGALLAALLAEPAARRGIAMPTPIARRLRSPLSFMGGKSKAGVRMPNHKRGCHPCRRLVPGPHSKPHVDDVFWKGAKWRFHYNGYGQLLRRERVA